MIDYKTKPFAQWMEDVLPEMVELNPESIGIVCIMPDGTSGTSYYNTDNAARTEMIRSMVQDNLCVWISANADMIRHILKESEADE